MRAHHGKDELAFLESHYPMIEFAGRTVKYNPEAQEMEPGEAVFYLDDEPFERNIKKGIVKEVWRAEPWNYSVYVIYGAKEEYYSCCLVWPDVERQKALNLANARKLLAESEK